MPEILHGAHAYTIGGKAHRILARLGDESVHFAQLLEAIGDRAGDVTAARRKKSWRRLDFMAFAGLITRDDRWFRITPEGLDVLDELNRALGYDLAGTPLGSTVRIFAKEQRA